MGDMFFTVKMIHGLGRGMFSIHLLNLETILLGEC